ncbi:MAG: protein kinase [Gemmataceae bacterium]
MKSETQSFGPQSASNVNEEPTINVRRNRQSETESKSNAKSVAGEYIPTNQVQIEPSELKTRLQKAWGAMPIVGEVIFGYRLEAELGRGAFGRVFLASQPELANRLVALKISANLTGESRALALLQHTNIVPVYSVHQNESLQGVCMPYFGAATVARLLGRFRETNSLPTTGMELVETLRFRKESTSLVDLEPLVPLPELPDLSRTLPPQLSSGTYVDAVCWLLARIADGLSHAHDRGLIHRDIKPANILVSDDGQPMLLDFGVAEEYRLRTASKGSTVGGTVPYMAPEQIEEFVNGVQRSDVRSDIYSLGIVLYELLTGRYPFPDSQKSYSEPTLQLLTTRNSAHLSIREFNLSVSPGLESIVLTCLQVDPRKRYQSAAALRDDLERHLSHRPLAIAPERSWKERFQKFSRRNPYITSNFTIGTAAMIVLMILGLGFVSRLNQLHYYEAQNAKRSLSEAIAGNQQILYAKADEVQNIRNAIDRIRASIDVYGFVEDPQWERRTVWSSLSETEQDAVRRDLADACHLIARGFGVLGTEAGPDSRDLSEALRFSNLAEKISGPNTSRVTFSLRQSLLKKMNRGEEATAASEIANSKPLLTARDFYFAAAEEIKKDNYQGALAFYRESRKRDPKFFWAYFGEGVCLCSLGQWDEARHHFTTAIALSPDNAWAYHNRGLAEYKLGNFNAAVADETRAIELQPDLHDAYLTRSDANRMRKDYQAALEDLDRAIGLGVPLSAIQAQRTLINRALGLDKKTPGNPGEKEVEDDTAVKTADEWIRFGIEQMEKDLEAANQSFDKALALEPKSVTGLLYKAHVLQRLSRFEECLDVLNRTLAVDKDNYRAYGGRAVVNARLKRWDRAIEDAKATLDRNLSAATVLQIACVYSLCSVSNPEYKSEAVTLLGIAVRNGVDYNRLAKNRDLDPIRSMPEYDRIIQSAKARTVPNLSPNPKP